MTDTTQGRSDAEVLAQVLARLGVGETLRLRRSGPGSVVEVLARADGALEVPAAVLGVHDAGPHVLWARHRSGELAAALVAALGDLELVTSSVVDGSGVERLLDGSGARTETTVDGLLDRWDLPLDEQIRRYLAQRFSVSPSELAGSPTGSVLLRLRGQPIAIDVLHGPTRIRVVAVVVQGIDADLGIGGSEGGVDGEQLDLTLHRFDDGGGLVRLHRHGNRVLAVVVLPAPTFMGQHLEAALDAVGSSAVLRMADALADAYGGVASFRQRPEPGDPTTHDDEEDPT